MPRATRYRQSGTSRFVASSRLGTSERNGIPYDRHGHREVALVEDRGLGAVLGQVAPRPLDLADVDVVRAERDRVVGPAARTGHARVSTCSPTIRRASRTYSWCGQPPVSLELVQSTSPAPDLGRDGVRRLGSEVPEEALRVAEVPLADRRPVAVEPLAVRAVEQVERERPDRVDVALPVRQQVGVQAEQVARVAAALAEVAAQQLELGRVVARRRLERAGGSRDGRSGRGGTGTPAGRRRPPRSASTGQPRSSRSGSRTNGSSEPSSANGDTRTGKLCFDGRYAGCRPAQRSP